MLANCRGNLSSTQRQVACAAQQAFVNLQNVRRSTVCAKATCFLHHPSFRLDVSSPSCVYRSENLLLVVMAFTERVSVRKLGDANQTEIPKLDANHIKESAEV
jgi:hypothetical protein